MKGGCCSGAGQDKPLIELRSNSQAQSSLGEQGCLSFPVHRKWEKGCCAREGKAAGAQTIAAPRAGTSGEAGLSSDMEALSPALHLHRQAIRKGGEMYCMHI